MTTARTPTGQDLVCLVCRTDKDIDIDHVVNRGMGGSKERDVPENKVPLCRECHTAKTNGVLETRLRSVGTLGLDLETGATSYESLWYEWRRKDADIWIPVPVEVSKRYKCLVLSAAAEGEDSATVPALSPAAPSAGQGVGTLEPPLLEVDVARMTAGVNLALTHEQRVDIARSIKGMEWNRQWFAGDTALKWERELGAEEAWQYIPDFGYVQESIANIIRVCGAIPEYYRTRNLRFSHYVVVADLNREDMEMWLDKCVEEEWSVSEFRRQVKGERLRVKRWTLEELREKAAEFWETPQDFNDFLDWLGDQA